MLPLMHKSKPKFIVLSQFLVEKRNQFIMNVRYLTEYTNGTPRK